MDNGSQRRSLVQAAEHRYAPERLKRCLNSMELIVVPDSIQEQAVDLSGTRRQDAVLQFRRIDHDKARQIEPIAHGVETTAERTVGIGERAIASFDDP